MTLSDLQGYSPIGCEFKCDFSYSCAAVDKISTNLARHAVPLQYLSFFWQTFGNGFYFMESGKNVIFVNIYNMYMY